MNFDDQKKEMIESQLKVRGISDSKVLDVIGKLPREKFLPDKFQNLAYSDGAQGIGYEQTISQPYIVAFMSEVLKLESGDRVLEIGTGSGYQAVVLAEIVKEVYSIEFVPELFDRTKKLLLKDLKYKNINLKCANGREGWPEFAPYDKIIVTAASANVPEKLIEQLQIGGRMIIPIVGRLFQELTLITKDADGVHQSKILPVAFVPLI